MTKPTTSRFGALKSVMSADLIENGSFCHFTVPEGMPKAGEPMYLDPEKKERPVGAMVRSADSKHFRSQGFKIQTLAISKTKRSKASEQDDAIEEQMQLERPRRFAAAVVTFRNTDPANPGDFTPTQEELIDLGQDGDSQWVVDQVMAHAFDKGNYPGDAGNAPAAGGAAKSETAPAE